MEQQASIVIAIVCVDWRMHHPDSNFMQALYKYLGNPERVYVVTYPGPDGLCGAANCDVTRKHFEETIAHTREVLVEHGARVGRKVLVVHSECAGHSVSDEEHRLHGADVARTLDAELQTSMHFEPLIAIKGATDLTWTVESVNRDASARHVVHEQRAPH
jgi:hypothetical protein